MRAGQVDPVVVYKIDRLTRSLRGFAQMMDVFDSCSASVVSVTQQFSTSSSMGRLTLNVLLSFAQFEREVSSERIRDKIAASKKRGIWMDGVAPLGYDCVDKQLVINAGEAKIVRTIFSAYLESGSATAVLKKLNAMGARTKSRTSAAGRPSGGGERWTLAS